MRKDKELEWNLGGERVRALGNILFTLRQNYAKAKMNPTKANMDKYSTMLQTLFMEIFAYMDENPREQVKKELREIKEDLRESQEAGLYQQEREQYLERLEDVDNTLNAARIDAGLDIPASTKLDEETALVDGLNQ